METWNLLISKQIRPKRLSFNKLMNGRGGGIRTPDPLLPKQMRYQAALRPDVTFRLYRESVSACFLDPNIEAHMSSRCQDLQCQRA